MASERTCGECRDCRHYRHALGDCYNGHSPVAQCKPDFGCVLFEAKPAPKVAARRELCGDVGTLVDAQSALERFPGNVTPIGNYTHVYNSSRRVFLFRYEEETQP